MELTKENLPQCALPDGKLEKLFHDDALPGFGLRVRQDAKGRVKRKWFFQYRSKLDGSQHRINLGNVDRPAAVTPEAARQAATLLSQRVQIGGDPQAERHSAKKDRARLFGDETLRYLDDRKAGVIGKRPMRLSTYKAAKAYFAQHWAPLQKRPVASISDNEVKDRLRYIIDNHGKTAAARAKSHLSAFYVWALKEGLAKINPTINTHVIAENPPRDRVFSDSEIHAIWSACRDDDFGRIVKLLFFTACRRDEIGGLRWSEIDLYSGVLTIPGSRTKSGRELQLTLPAQALDVLRTIPRKADRDFLFGQTGGAFSRWSWEKLSIDKRLAESGMTLEPYGLHDIRRTVRTRLGKLKVKPHVAELVLGHTAHKVGIVGTYDHHDYADEIKDALATWANALMAIVAPTADSNVKQFKRA